MQHVSGPATRQAQPVQGGNTDSQAQTVGPQQPTSLKLPNGGPLPASPFTTAPMGKLQLNAKAEAEAHGANHHDNSPYTPSAQSKFPWADSPRQSYSEGENLAGQVGCPACCASFESRIS